MATREGTRASIEFACISIVPDVCKSPSVPVPYNILSKFDSAVNFSTNVRFRKQWVFRHDSRLSTVLCDEPGVGGGILSGVNKGYCRPIDGTSSSTVRVNGAFVDYHEGTYMFMNCAGPEGPFNTIGKVIFLGNMLPGPVTPAGKIPKGIISGIGGVLSDVQSSIGDIEGLIKKSKKLYDLAKTDWSDPSAVLGAIGGVAGIAGLQDVADVAKQAKDLYDVGDKIANTDWSDPKQAIAAIAGASKVAGMDDIAKVAEIAKQVNDVIETDWSDPKAALAAAQNMMEAAGLDKMLAELAKGQTSKLVPDGSSNGTTPSFFPPPGLDEFDAPKPSDRLPSSDDGKPRQRVTGDVYDHLKKTNPVAAQRYDLLSDEEKKRAFVEFNQTKDTGKITRRPKQMAVYIPGEGFSTTEVERDGLWNVSKIIPREIREVFVADKDDATKGNFFGIREKEGNVYLFGGLIDLGSPGMPGAGDAKTWWIPDRILNMDMSPYYDFHDKNYYGSDVGLGDLGKILQTEVDAFKAGATMNPLQLPIQAIYSAATTAVGLLTASKNSATDFGQGAFDSLGDFFGSVFGESPAGAGNPMQSIVAGGCTGIRGSASSGPGGAPGGGTKPKTPGPVESGNASGAGTDGILVTTAQGNPAAAAAAIEAQFRKDNQKALEKAQAEEKAKQEKATSEKAKSKADQTTSDSDGDTKPRETLATKDKETNDYDPEDWHPDDRISMEEILDGLWGLADLIGGTVGPGKVAGRAGQILEGTKDVFGAFTDLKPTRDGSLMKLVKEKLKKLAEIEREIAMYRKAIVELSKVHPTNPPLLESIEKLSELNDSLKAERNSIIRELSSQPLLGALQEAIYIHKHMI